MNRNINRILKHRYIAFSADIKKRNLGNTYEVTDIKSWLN